MSLRSCVRGWGPGARELDSAGVCRRDQKWIAVPGASKALLDTHAYKNTRRYQKDLFAVYPQGIVQVSMDYSTALPDSRLIAVMRLVART